MSLVVANVVTCDCDMPAVKRISWLPDHVGRRFWGCSKNEADPSRCRFRQYIDGPFERHAHGVIETLRSKLGDYRQLIILQSGTILKLREREREAVANLDLVIHTLEWTVVCLGVFAAAMWYVMG